MPNYEGNRGTKTILGNREHKKTYFGFLGNGGTSQLISGEQWNIFALPLPLPSPSPPLPLPLPRLLTVWALLFLLYQLLINLLFKNGGGVRLMVVS